MENFWAAIPLLAIVFGLANHDRGRGTLPGGRIACALYGGISTGLVGALLGLPLAHAAGIAVAVSLGFFNWLVWGWGLYFSAFHGLWNKDEKEIGWIDYICLKLVPFVTSAKHKTNYIRGWIGMTLRGLYLIPMFIVFDPFALFTPNAVWLLGIFGLLQGTVYAANRLSETMYSEGTAYPELIMGLLIGALSGTALLLIAS